MKRSVTVTVATRVFEPEGSAAAYRLGALVRSLIAAGFHTKVLTTRAPGAPRSTPAIRRWPVLRDRSGSVRGYVQYASFDIPLFFRLLFGRRSDIVVAEPPPSTGAMTRLACWLRRTPYVYFSADVLSSAVAGIGLNPVVVTIVRRLEQFALRGASVVLAVSDDVRAEVIALGAHPERVAVVGTGIDTHLFSPNGPNAGVDYPYLVYAGTMSEVHGAGIFVEAFEQIRSQHPKARLKMFGSGVEAEDLKRRAGNGNQQVEFLGTVDSAELSSWLRGARASLASVRPQRGYDFAFATKALAALSCGTPVIYSGVGPLAALISENSLGWATPWEVGAVAEAMAAALDLPYSGPSERLSTWVDSNFSLTAVAERAVAAIDQHLTDAA